MKAAILLAAHADMALELAWQAVRDTASLVAVAASVWVRARLGGSSGTPS